MESEEGSRILHVILETTGDVAGSRILHVVLKTTGGVEGSRILHVILETTGGVEGSRILHEFGFTLNTKRMNTWPLGVSFFNISTI